MKLQDMIAQAKLHAIGGVLTAADKQGLRTRGERMGYSADEVEAMINEIPAAKRVPLQHEQWR